MIELPLLKVRSFAVADAGDAGLLHRLRHDAARRRPAADRSLGLSELSAGFALPGPLMAAALAIPSGRLGARIGQRPVAIAGGLVFAASFAYILAGRPEPRIRLDLPARLHARRHRRRDDPGDAAGGGDRGAPGARFATGSAVFGMARRSARRSASPSSSPC